MNQQSLPDEDRYKHLCERILEHCHVNKWYGPDAYQERFLETYFEDGEFRTRELPDEQRIKFEFSPVTEEQLRKIEDAMGCVHPPLLRTLYLQVANGGFGPGYGLTGIPGGSHHRSWRDIRYDRILKENSLEKHNQTIELSIHLNETHPIPFDLEQHERLYDNPRDITLSDREWPTYFLQVCQLWDDGIYVHAKSGHLYLATYEVGVEKTLRGDLASICLYRLDGTLEDFFERWLVGISPLQWYQKDGPINSPLQDGIVETNNTEKALPGKQDKPLTRADVEELLEQVGSSEKLDLTSCNLQGIDLSNLELIGAKLSHTNLSHANLAFSDLSKSNLSHTTLVKANLSDAYITDANLVEANLTGANLDGTKLFRTDLSRANLNFANFIGVDLAYSDLTEATLIKAIISRATLIETQFLRANLSDADLSHANLREANLAEVALSGASLLGADLSKANLSRAKLVQANLFHATLTEANLSGVNFSKADLSHTDLSEADLSKADLADANLSQCTLIQADLSEANLTNANLTEINLTKGTLIGAKLTEADLSKATFAGANLTKANLSSAKLLQTDLQKTNLSYSTLVEAKLSSANLAFSTLVGADLSGVDLTDIDLETVVFSVADLRRNAHLRAKILLKIKEINIQGNQ